MQNEVWRKGMRRNKASVLKDAFLRWNTARIIRRKNGYLAPPQFVDKRGLAFKVEGDSMYPTLEPGEIIYVDFDREPFVGEIGVVKLHSGDSIVRRVREKSIEMYVLQACNVAYGPIIAKKDEIKHICKVVMKEFL